MHQRIEPGTRFSSWTVLEHRDGPWYKCKCVCGKVGLRQAHDLRSGKSKQCKGCATAARNTTHGHAVGNGSSEYSSYSHMIKRCTNPKSKDYPRYGGRGITVCDMWLHSFEAFLMCMGKKPDPSYTIERIDTDKGYEPGNCIWATRREQNQNKSNIVYLTIEGQTKTMTEWSRDPRCTVNVATIHKRLKKGMEPYDAVFAPSGGRK